MMSQEHIQKKGRRPHVTWIISLTQKWQKHGVVVGHHKQVDTVQGCAGL